MEKTIVTTGKTIELAVAAALEQLKLDRDSVSVEVLENAKSGFLGIGASPAKVKVTYDAPNDARGAVQEDVAPKAALSSASRRKKVQTEPTKETRAFRKMPEMPRRELPKQKTEQQKSAPQQAKVAAPKQSAPRRPAAEKSPARVPVPMKEYAPAAAGSVEERIEQFLTGLMQHMGSNAVPHAWQVDEQCFRAELVGTDVGLLIGRRGDTLDAIQCLTSYSINRDAEKRVRVSVDAGDYRLKREEALQHLAKKMAGKAIKYRRNFTLEPMNAYERHIIHVVLQDYPEVTTFSTGTEPYRRIVVAYAREKASGNRQENSEE